MVEFGKSAETLTSNPDLHPVIVRKSKPLSVTFSTSTDNLSTRLMEYVVKNLVQNQADLLGSVLKFTFSEKGRSLNDVDFTNPVFPFDTREVRCDFKSLCEFKLPRLKTNQTRLDKYRDSLMSKFRR
jgi:hypothetical protein